MDLNFNPLLAFNVPPDKQLTSLDPSTVFEFKHQEILNNENLSSTLLRESNETLQSEKNVALNGNGKQHIQILENIEIHDDLTDSDSMDFEDQNGSANNFKLFNTIKRKRLSTPSKLDLSTFKTNNSNRFAILGEIEMKEDNTGKNNIQKNDVKTNKIETKNENFCPPIFIYNLNIKMLVDQLKSKNVIFKIVNKSRFKSKLYLKDANAHQEMMMMLREKKIESYSFTPKELKKKNIVLRGLYYLTDINEIKNEIDLLAPNAVDTVSKFKTVYSRKNNVDTGLFLITLLPGKTLNVLSHIKYILSQVVSWESPKANSKEVQCWRCQHWGHFSKNCNRSHACVKCSEIHNPGECKVVVNEQTKPFCVNCNKLGHPANWRGCPTYKKYVINRTNLADITKERNLIASKNVNRAVNELSFISNNKSFAQCFNNSPKITEKEYRKPPLIEEFLKIARVLCKEETLTLEDRISLFINNYKNGTISQAKNECSNLLKEIQNVYGK